MRINPGKHGITGWIERRNQEKTASHAKENLLASRTHSHRAKFKEVFSKISGNSVSSRRFQSQSEWWDNNIDYCSVQFFKWLNRFLRFQFFYKLIILIFSNLLVGDIKISLEIYNYNILWINSCHYSKRNKILKNVFDQLNNSTE